MVDPLSACLAYLAFRYWNDYKERTKKEKEGRGKALECAVKCQVCRQIIMSYDQYYLDTGTGRVICQDCHDQGNYRGPLMIGRRF